MSISVRNIYYRYGDDLPQIFEDFSAEFLPGKITAVTGANGTGKTTLSKLILGILRPQSGEIYIDGDNARELTLASAGRRVGYVMQNPARQIFSPTVKEEMEFGLRILGLDADRIRQKTDEYLKYFDIAKYADGFPFALSRGEKQRLVLAAVLAMEPAYLMLDEPTASLDSKRKEMLRNYLLKIRAERGCGIIIISHDREFVEACADKRVHLEAGERDV